MGRIFEENRLISLLREFDTNLALSYLQKIKKFNDALEDINLIDHVIPIKDPTLTEPVAFRLEFSEPIYVLLSHPLCRMHARVLYPIEFEWERFYVTRLGMLPAFFVGLNTITLIKFWSEAADQTSPGALKGILRREAISMKLAPSQRNIPYSTMNFIIAFGADLWKTRETSDEIMRNYLKYSYWASPKPGFSFSTHFLHTRASIKYILKVAKTLCLIDRLGRQTKIQILGRMIKAYKIGIRMLTEKNGTVYFMKRKAYIPKDVFEELLLKQAQEEIKLSESFINAIVLEIREKKGSFELLSVLSDIGASYFELTQTLIGYVLMKIFNSKEDKISLICTINELETNLTNILNQIGRHIRLPSTLSDRINETFTMALGSHFPLFVVDGKDVYYTHPLLFSFLLSKNRFNLLLQKQNLIKLLKYLKKIREKTPYIDLYLDETLDMFQGQSKKELLSEFYQLVRHIKIAKLLQRCF